MKKIRIIPLMLTAALCSGCSGNPETPPEQDISALSETFTETTVTNGETTAHTSLTRGESDYSETDKEAFTEKSMETASKAITETLRETDDYDDIALLSFTAVGSDEEPDHSALYTAVAAYRESVYYKDALENVRGIYSYENGELVVSEEYAEHWYSLYVKEFIMPHAAPEIDIDAFPVYCRKAKFDGENEGNLILLEVALPDSLFSWSGTAMAHIPVYVNNGGEAFILDSACSQDYSECFTLDYENGKCHAVFNYGHNMGGMETEVYSFEEGKPKRELKFYGHIYPHEDMKVISCYNDAPMHTLFFFNPQKNEYCGFCSTIPTEKQALALCGSDAVINDNVPDPYELYKEGRLWVTGGKYFNFGCPYSYTYCFDGDIPKRSDIRVIDIYYGNDGAYFELHQENSAFPLYNIKL